MTGGPCIAAGLSITATEAAKADSSGRRNTLTKEVAMNDSKAAFGSVWAGAIVRHQVDRRWQDEMSGDGSGRRSRQAWRVRMLRSRPVCRRR